MIISSLCKKNAFKPKDHFYADVKWFNFIAIRKFETMSRSYFGGFSWHRSRKEPSFTLRSRFQYWPISTFCVIFGPIVFCFSKGIIFVDIILTGDGITFVFSSLSFQFFRKSPDEKLFSRSLFAIHHLKFLGKAYDDTTMDKIIRRAIISLRWKGSGTLSPGLVSYMVIYYLH